MKEDWRFRESPHVEFGGLKAYAGVPLRMQHESGEAIGLGTICVVSGTGQDPLPKTQQQTLACLADWIVADVVKCTRARRQRERHRMAELIATIQHDTEDPEPEDPILKALKVAYPDEFVSLQSTKGNHVEAEGQRLILPTNLENGLWEDTTLIDDFIASSNQNPPPNDRVVRLISAQCESRLGSSLLIVATKDFRRIFDDIDSWFLQSCATLLTQRWQSRLLSEVIRVKEKFLRGVSHQLRTPIHGILGAAELFAEDLTALGLSGDTMTPSELVALDRLANLGKSATYLDTISTAGRELMSTVNSMITLNRWADIAVADRQYALHSIDKLEAELEKSTSVFVSRMRSKPSIFFHCDIPRECHSLWLDLNLFRDSVLPLITNAIQNTSEGTVTITLSINLDTKMLVVDVEDTGCGIHTGDQERIFDLYEKADEHSTGAGLGLALATKFSSLLNGSIELVSSDVGTGSHFRAKFQDVDCTISPTKTISNLEHLPSKFYNLSAGSNSTSLFANLTKSLTRNGFTASESAKDCLLILDHVPDVEERRAYFSTIPQTQIAIYPIPSHAENDNAEMAANVVFVEGPFSTSTISRALAEANSLLAAMISCCADNPEVKELVVRPAKETSTIFDSLTQKLRVDNGSSNSDEGYGSQTRSPSLGFESSQAPPSACDSSLDTMFAPSTCQAGEAADPETPVPPLKSVTKSAKPRALLVDDNIVNLRILQMYCKKRGLPYCSAADGQEAVKIFSEQQALAAAGKSDPIELVLMDLQMPVCNGIEATNQIRSLEKENGWGTSVLFIVTGQDSKTDKEVASAAGADDYLVKPVGMKLLDSDVKRHFPNFGVD